ncbi:hypothetical protein [Robertkochia solimangrovi]|uniref:hypothetical protein n=1 Tax=Robertkochia solimangrovi TaxID=2213046 RepID=UPI00117D9787|nr:hypothetical protein [Robertkochia solimangrovi]TRZ45155.1 hypothetical protein DMZ48_05235 [Robertkochia solimangrovi]
MEELDFFKKEWQKKSDALPKLSYDELYAMILKRSRSTVKWIFIVCLMEFVLGLLITLLYHPQFEKNIKVPPFLEWTSYLLIPVLVYFIYRFFSNYRKISADSSVKGLLDNIIRSRRTVKAYILFNLIYGGIISMYMMIHNFVSSKGGWDEFISHADSKEYLLVIGVTLISTAIVLGFFIGFYALIYGFFMRRLKRNYNELKKIEF